MRAEAFDKKGTYCTGTRREREKEKKMKILEYFVGTYAYTCAVHEK